MIMFGNSLDNRRAAILAAGLHGRTAARRKNIPESRKYARIIQREARLYGRREKDSNLKKQAAQVEAAAEGIDEFLKDIVGHKSATQFWEATQKRFALIVSISLKWRLHDVSSVSEARKKVREHDKSLRDSELLGGETGPSELRL